ncbi:MAG: hypothetical protein JOZ81_19435, partial [Chloroflexi bacterium]|nr:hypothetical protein [Chloroflexota bacterium]
MINGSRLLLLGLGLVAVLVPGGPGQVLGGAPLGAAGILGVALVVYAAVALAVPRWRALIGLGFAAVIALKVALAMTAPQTGLTAQYWASPTA